MENYVQRTFSARRSTAPFYADAFHSFGWELVGSESSLLSGGAVIMTFRRPACANSASELSALQREFENRAGEVEALEEKLERRAAVLSISIGALGLFLFIFSLVSWASGSSGLFFPALSLGLFFLVVSLFVHTLVIDSLGREAEPEVRQVFSRMYELKSQAEKLRL